VHSRPRAQRLSAECASASCVVLAAGSELRAHSGLRKTETWKSLRMMSDRAKVLSTVRLRILSLAFELVTPSWVSLSWNWICLREPRASFLSTQSPSSKKSIESIGLVNSKKMHFSSFSLKATPSGLRDEDDDCFYYYKK